MNPYCFILMPYGKKKDAGGRTVDFDLVYTRIFKPAIEAAALTPIRADEEAIGGIVLKPMFERLMLCDYAIADLSLANANVFYELGIRHGIRPHSTLLTASRVMRLPFDVRSLRVLPYSLDEDGVPNQVDQDVDKMVVLLKAFRDPVDDSPLYQLVSDAPRLEIPRLKTDTFRDSIKYAETYKEKLRVARGRGVRAVHEVETELGKLTDTDPAILIDLFLSYRAVEDWDAMIALVKKMPPMLQETVLVQEQLGFAYNRRGDHTQAENILLNLIDTYGTSSETNGILGRVYKDLWTKAQAAGQHLKGKAYLKKAIACYVEGFEADWRDAYPGINAVSLMEMLTPPDLRQAKLLPIVRYAVERRLSAKHADYWDYATLMELSILARDQEAAEEALSQALVEIRESWEPKTTANNLQQMIAIRTERGEDTTWIQVIHDALMAASRKMAEAAKGADT